MMGEKANANEKSGFSVSKKSGVTEQAKITGVYGVTCIGPKEHLRKAYVALRDSLASASKDSILAIKAEMEGMTELKWRDIANNAVTDEGANELLEQGLDGSAYTAAWYMALQNGAAPTAASTYAVPICTEVTAYAEANRPTPAFSAAGTPTAREKTTSSDVAFSINADATVVDGVMLMNLNTKGNTAGGGKLYSAGDFTGGTKNVDNGDTLNVSYTASL